MTRIMPINQAKSQVMSIPAGDAYAALEANHVYSCPVTRGYPEIAERYVAFRQTGGEMHEIYYVEAVFTLMPHDEVAWGYIAADHRQRIRQYILDRAEYFAASRDMHRFYLLVSDTLLPHHPRPEKNNAYRCAYSWQELTVGEDVIVR